MDYLKSGVYKARQGGISKPALLCRYYRKFKEPWKVKKMEQSDTINIQFSVFNFQYPKGLRDEFNNQIAFCR